MLSCGRYRHYVNGCLEIVMALMMDMEEDKIVESTRLRANYVNKQEYTYGN